MSPQDFHPQQDRDRGQFSSRLARFGARHYLLAGALGLLVGSALLPGFSLAPLVPKPLSRWAEAHLLQLPRQELPLQINLPYTPGEELGWQTLTVRSGETLSTLFRRARLQPSIMHQVLQAPLAAGRLRTLHPGHQIQFGLDAEGKLQRLHYEIDLLNALDVQHTSTGFVATQSEKDVLTRQQYASGQIESSLFAAGEDAGMSDTLVMELANVFGYDIDFALDLRRGDRFSLVYEEKLVDGVPYGGGTVLAAEFVNQGQTFRAVRYVAADGTASYYAPDGKALRKAFLRAPLQFSRVSSNFSLSRKHPILNTIRAHKGVDYAALSGTPVYAAGDGKVSFAGVKNGFGRIVAIQHGSQFETHYAHLSAFCKGLRSGARVSQGQVIGYVGMSGLATAPHLHYEFLVNGAFKNPRTVPLPQAEPIAKAEHERFMAMVSTPLTELQNRSRLTIASNQ